MKKINFIKSVSTLALAVIFVLGFSGCDSDSGDGHEHIWNDGEITVAATEDAEGVKTFTCTTCEQKKTEIIAKLDHTHVIGTLHEAVAGTCTAPGTKAYYSCTKATCEAKLDAEGNELSSIAGELNPANHSGTATTWTKTPTTHKEVYDCCNAVKIAEAAHTFGEWVSNNDATEAADGTKTRTCSVEGCGYSEIVTDEGSKIVKVTFTLMRTGKDESGNYTNTTYKVEPGTTWGQFIQAQNPPYYTVYENDGSIFHDNEYSLECDCGGDYVYANGDDAGSYTNYVTKDTVIAAGQYGCEYCFK